MPYLEILSWVAGIASFVFAVYSYMRSRTQRITETAKIAIQRERMRNLHFGLQSALYSADAIVQIAKRDDASVEMLQNMARLLRGQLYALAEQAEKERGRLREWKFGKMVETVDEEELELVRPEAE